MNFLMRTMQALCVAVCLAATTSLGCKGCNQLNPKDEAPGEHNQSAAVDQQPSSAESSPPPATGENSTASNEGDHKSPVDRSEANPADDAEAAGGGEGSGGKRGSGGGEGAGGREGGDGSSGENPTASRGGGQASGSGVPHDRPPPRLASPKFKTADAALKFAGEQRVAADKQASKKEYAKAYLAMLRGWQALQPYLSNSQCERLAVELMVKIEDYGDQLGTNGQPLDKPLRIQ